MAGQEGREKRHNHQGIHWSGEKRNKPGEKRIKGHFPVFLEGKRFIPLEHDLIKRIPVIPPIKENHPLYGCIISGGLIGGSHPKKAGDKENKKP
jgi:hypothetical protein